MPTPPEDNAAELDWLHDVEIRECRLGQGVYAAREICEGEVIGVVHGAIVNGNDCSPEYCIEMDADHSLDPSPPFRFLNHCCEPNAELVSEDVSDDGCFPDVYLYAIRDLAIGEEVRIDYAWPADDAIRCQCSSESCRGWVVAEEELSKVDRDE